MNNLVFWSWTGQQYSLDFLKMIKALELKGIRKYYINESDTTSKPILVDNQNNKIKQVTEDYLLRILIDIIKEHGNDHILEMFLRSRNKLSEERLSLLPKLDKPFLKDTHDHSFFFFQNQIVQVSRNKIISLPYSDLNGLIWESQIIKHDLNLISIEEIQKGFSFYKFLTDVTKHDVADSKARLSHLQTLIGYLLHGYKNPINSKAVIIMDENPSNNPEGGTGKTLIANATGMVRKVITENGKGFKPNETFAFQQVGPDTSILLIDDAHKHFEFEKLFSAITSGLSVEKKNRDKFTIPFEASPKILITTNYAISGVGASYRRRLFEFELSQHFNDRFTPIDAYKEPFFEQWKKQDWDSFYSLLIVCTEMYLSSGIKLSKPINLTYKKLINELEPDLVDFISKNLVSGKEYDKKIFYEKLKTSVALPYNISVNRITRMIEKYADILDHKIVPRHSGKQSFFKMIPKFPQ